MNSITVSRRAPLARSEIQRRLVEARPLLGRPWLVAGEEREQYDKLLLEVAIALGAEDVIGFLLAADVVDASWQIRRGREVRRSVMRKNRRRSIPRVVGRYMNISHDETRRVEVEIEKRLRECGERGTTQEDVLREYGVAWIDVEAQTLLDESATFDALHRRDEELMKRREVLLRDIERRQSGDGQQSRGLAEEVIDGDAFVVDEGEPPAARNGSPGGGPPAPETSAPAEAEATTPGSTLMPQSSG